MSWFGYISDTYSVLWKMIIRPPRARYSRADLGPQTFRIGANRFEREDIKLKNDRGMELACSHYRPQGRRTKMPCVVYLHANASCRLEALDVLDVLLPRGISVFSFDFCGCGRSDGEYISLGFWEEQDLSVVVKYLRGEGLASTVALWGRSMGGATAVFRAAQDPSLAACVIDSAFGSLHVVMEELVGSGAVPIPSFLLNMAISIVGEEVKSRAEFDFDGLAPVDEAPFAVAPVLFGVASDDEFIAAHHTYDICNAWGGPDKNVIAYDGGHNGQRPDFWHRAVSEFLVHRLKNAESQSFLRDSAAKARQLRNASKAQNKRPTTQSEIPASLRNLPLPRESDSKGAPADAAVSSAQHSELVAMGFDPRIAAEALKRSSSVEGALDFIMQQSVQALGNLNTMEVRAPDRRRDVAVDSQNHAPVMAGYPSSKQESSTTGGVGSLTSINSDRTAGNVLQQLTNLGISPENAAEAARRCSSVEAAMEWLATNDKL